MKFLLLAATFFVGAPAFGQTDRDVARASPTDPGVWGLSRPLELLPSSRMTAPEAPRRLDQRWIDGDGPVTSGVDHGRQLSDAGISAGANVSGAAPTVASSFPGRAPGASAADTHNVADWGAVGDGRRLTVTATIAAGSDILTVASAGVFSAADVGKAFVLNGAGEASAPLTGTVVAYMGPRSLRLSTKAATALSSAARAALDIGTDDTISLQSAINAAGMVSLVPGRVYLVRNLTLPSVPASAMQPQGGIVVPGGMATIRAIGGGDSAYLASSETWQKNSPWSSEPALYQNVLFDGNGMVRDVVVPRAYQVTWSNVHFANGLGHGLALYGVGKDGTTPLHATQNMPSNIFLNCQVYGNMSHGFYNEAATDLQVFGGHYHDNGGGSGYDIYLAQTAGLQLQGVHTYNISNKSLFLALFGWSSIVSNNVFEGDVLVESVATTFNATFGPANSIGGNVTFLSNVSSPGTVVTRSAGNRYYGSSSQLINSYNSRTHTVISDGDSFLSNAPFAFGGQGSSLYAINTTSYNAGLGTNGLATYNGLQGPSFGPQAQSRFETIKPLASDGSTTFMLDAIVTATGSAGFVAECTIEANTEDSTRNLDVYSGTFLALYSRQAFSENSARRVAPTKSLSIANTIGAEVDLVETPSSDATSVKVVFKLRHAVSVSPNSFGRVTCQVHNRFVNSMSLH